MEHTEDSAATAVHEQWIALVNKAIADFESLTPHERIWFTVQALLQEADNGGLISHYYNHGGERTQETIEDLITLGFPEVADLLYEINDLFPCGDPPRNIEERLKIMATWEGEEYDYLDDFLEELDEQFYSRKNEIEEELQNLISGKLV